MLHLGVNFPFHIRMFQLGIKPVTSEESPSDKILQPLPDSDSQESLNAGLCPTGRTFSREKFDKRRRCDLFCAITHREGIRVDR